MINAIFAIAGTFVAGSGGAVIMMTLLVGVVGVLDPTNEAEELTSFLRSRFVPSLLVMLTWIAGYIIGEYDPENEEEEGEDA